MKNCNNENPNFSLLFIKKEKQSEYNDSMEKCEEKNKEIKDLRSQIRKIENESIIILNKITDKFSINKDNFKELEGKYIKITLQSYEAESNVIFAFVNSVSLQKKIITFSYNAPKSWLTINGKIINKSEFVLDSEVGNESEITYECSDTCILDIEYIHIYKIEEITEDEYNSEFKKYIGYVTKK